MKKIISIILALSALLIGCSVNKETNIEENVVSKESDNSVKLTYYINNRITNDFDRIMEKANKISKEAINITLDLIPIDDSAYADKMNMMINSGESFDLCFTGSWGGMDYFQNAARGAYAELTPEMISKYAPKSYANVPEKFWDGVKVNSKIYGMINYQQWGISVAKGVGIRRDLAEEFNFDWKSIKKLEDVEPFLELVKKNKKDMIPFEYSPKSDVFILNSLLWGMDPVGDSVVPGWVRVDTQGKPIIINQYETLEYASHIDMMRRWYQKGYIRSDAATFNDFMPDRTNNRIAVQMIQGFPDCIDEPGLIESTIMSHTKPGEAPAVSINLMKPFAPASGPSAAVTAIGSNSKNIEKSLQMIEFINTNDAYFNLITLGEENVDFEYAKEDSGDVEKGTWLQIDGKYNFNFMDWAFGQSYSPDFTRAKYDKNAYGELSKKMQGVIFEADKNGMASPIMGFTFDPANVKTQMANCSAVTSELVAALGSGSVDPKKVLPDFIKRLKEAGADDIIKAKQEQIDIWYETKR